MGVTDEVACQILINASAVGRLITALALELGLRPLRLVRSQASADALQTVLPRAPILVTSSPDWQEKVRRAAGGSPVYVALDGVETEQRIRFDK